MDITVDSINFRKRRLITEEEVLANEESGDECFNAIGCFQSNVYVGTTMGQLLHYHRFDDSPNFLLISQQKIRNDSISKIVVMPMIKKVIVLVGKSMNLFSLPELSPLQSGKLKDVINITKLNDNDIMILMEAKIKIIRFKDVTIRAIGEINNIKPIEAIKHNSNNLITIANNNDYEIIDLTNHSKTPLFQYSNDSNDSNHSNDPNESNNLSVIKPKMVAFHAKDTNQEEILLTIKSDINTSIGMFIKANGEPTRGTLTWIDKGYPSNGVAIHWPYVLSVFESSQLVISSLETFEIVKTEEMERNSCLQFLSIPASIHNDNYVINGICKKSISSNMIIYAKNTIDLLYVVNNIDIFQKNLKQLILGETEEIKFIDNDDNDSSDLLYQQLLFLYNIFMKSYEKCTVNDNLFSILMYLNGGTGSGSGSEETNFYQGTKEIAEILKTKLDDDFKTYYIDQIRLLYLTSHKLNLQKIAYSNLNNDKEFIEFVNKDKDSWKIKTPNLINIIRSLQENKLYLSSLYAYILLQDDEEICSISVKFLSKEYEYNEELLDSLFKFNFVDLILKSLDKVKSDKIYRDSLLEILRVDSTKGISYMKKNVNGKHKDAHNGIMKEMISLANNADFTALKLEILENSYKDGTGDLDEILNHLIEMLKNPNDIDKNNFMVLISTYKIENNFDSHKDIISFVDYLQITKNATECKDFIEIYLKTFELLNYQGGDNNIDNNIDNNDILKGIIDEPIYEFFKICFIDTDKTIKNLLELGDFYSAEYTAIYNKPPYPKHKYYITENLLKHENCKSNLQEIFESYKSNNDFRAIKHFIYNYDTIYSPNEIINMLPSDISISFIKDYFIRLFINLDSLQRKLLMKKIFSRQESSLTKDIYTDLHSQLQ